MMKLTQTIASFTLLASIQFVSAQAPKYSNEFLSIGVGGRALGMSDAQVASVNDVTAGFWNPAGLTLIKSDVQVTAMHSEYFAGIAKFDYGAIGKRIDDSRALCFSIVRFSVDDIPNTLDLIDASGNINYDKLKSFAAADYAFYFSYAKKAKLAGLRYGGSAKIIHRVIGDFGKAWGFGFDLGAQYERGNWNFGVLGKDVTSTFNAWSYNTDQFAETFALTNNEIPKNSMEITLPKLILAAAYKTNLSKKFSLLAELDNDMTFDGQRNEVISSNPVSVDPHIGLEIGYDDFIFLRGGVMNIQKVKNVGGGSSTIYQPNMGIGIRLKNFSIEYALSNVGSQETLYSNIFSLKLDIYKHK
ncbi:MAG: PorV/PorQ family protein [Bacteroidetes bacterium]|nr:PorV/PorQ family protein [Bacteroidota bacterium]